MELEIQTMIDEQLRSEMEIEFSKQEARQAKIDFENSIEEPIVESDFEADEDIELDEDDNAKRREKLRQEKAKREEDRRVQARREFERQLDEKLLQNQVSVRLTNWESKKIYVLGDVNSPGSFLYIGNETVLDAIIEAGGLGTRANHHNIVSRPSRCGECRTIMKVCYDQIVQLGDASTNYQLMPGDRVFVPSMTFMDDLKQTFHPFRNEQCPRCAGCDKACNLPSGCQ